MTEDENIHEYRHLKTNGKVKIQTVTSISSTFNKFTPLTTTYRKANKCYY